MNVVPIERKSAVLTSSDLACLSNIATINLTAGCALGCIYCYTLGYSSTPRNGTVYLYANTAEKLAQELKRKRKLPHAVYFSPSSDLFQPHPEILDLALEILEILFQRNIGVSFLTKGHIPQRHMELLKSNAPLVQAQIGLITVDEKILQLFEPQAAPPQIRLDQAQELVEAGISTTGRLDPILPGLTDDESSFRDVCSAFAETGISSLAAGTLFLRPAITGSLKKICTTSQCEHNCSMPSQRRGACRSATVGVRSQRFPKRRAELRLRGFEPLRPNSAWKFASVPAKTRTLAAERATSPVAQAGKSSRYPN